MGAHRAVIAHEHDDCLVGQPGLIDRVQYSASIVVELHQAIAVNSYSRGSFKFWRREIRIVRSRPRDEQEEWSVAVGVLLDEVNGLVRQFNVDLAARVFGVPGTITSERPERIEYLAFIVAARDGVQPGSTKNWVSRRPSLARLSILGVGAPLSSPPP